MDSQPKISQSQLFCILMLSRIATEAVYPHSGGGTDSVTAIVLAEVIRFVIALPILIYSFKGNGFYGAILRKNRFFGWISAAGASLMLLGYAVHTAYFNAEFTQRSLIPEVPFAVICVILALFALYAAWNGIEAVARGGVLFLAAAVIIIIITMIADIPYMQWDRQLSAAGTDNFLTELINRLMRGGEYLVFAALLPYVRCEEGHGGRTAVLFALSGTLAAVLLCGFFLVTLGNFYSLAEYPLAAAASLADIALFKRLDGIVCAVLALCGAFRSALMLTGAWLAVVQLLPAKTQPKQAF